MNYAESPKLGSAPQFTFDLSKMKTYKAIIEWLKLQYSNRKVQREYEPSSRPQGLLIGGAAVAASAMAAAQTSGEYSLAREALPYLPENRRNETGDNMLKVEVPGNQLSKDQNKKGDSYGKYNASYKNYQDKIYLARQKLQQIYQDAVSRLGKLSAFYGGRVKSAIRKLPYNPFKRLGLESRMGNVRAYSRQTAPVYSLVTRTRYSTQVPSGYNRREKDLEDIIKAA